MRTKAIPVGRLNMPHGYYGTSDTGAMAARLLELEPAHTALESRYEELRRLAEAVLAKNKVLRRRTRVAHA